MFFTETKKLLLIRTEGSAVDTGTVDLPVGVDFRVTFIVAGTSISALLFANDTTLTVADTLSGTLPAAVSMTAVRDGIITATGLGQDVTLDIIWPQEDSATDPGPRTYPTYPVGPPRSTCDSHDSDSPTRPASAAWLSPRRRR